MGVAHKTGTDAGRELILRLRKAATVNETPRLMDLLAGDLTFLDALVRGLEWTADNVEGFGHPTISLEEDPEEDTDYLLLTFPVSLGPKEGAKALRGLTERWIARAWRLAPVELCVTEAFA